MFKKCSCRPTFFLNFNFHVLRLWLTGREHLSAYVDYDNYDAATTTTPADNDDTTQPPHLHQHQQHPSTSRLYDKPPAAVSGYDVIDTVMRCNQPTQGGNTPRSHLAP